MKQFYANVLTIIFKTMFWLFETYWVIGILVGLLLITLTIVLLIHKMLIILCLSTIVLSIYTLIGTCYSTMTNKQIRSIKLLITESDNG